MFKSLFQRTPTEKRSSEPVSSPPAALSPSRARQEPTLEPEAAPAATSPQSLRRQGFAALSLAQLQARRRLVDEQQHATLEQLTDMEAERQGIVDRYATARLNGQKIEMEALERTFESIGHRIQSATVRHADLLLDLSLIDEACTLREDLAAREGLERDGLNLESLGELMGDQLAQQLSSRNKRQNVLDGVRDHRADVLQHTLAAQRPIRDELTRLTEDQVQRAQGATLQPLESVADRIDQQLAQQPIRRTASSAKAAASPTPASKGAA